MSLSAVLAGLVGVAGGRPLSLALAENAANVDAGCNDEDAAAPLDFAAGLITNVGVCTTACAVGDEGSTSAMDLFDDRRDGVISEPSDGALKARAMASGSGDGGAARMAGPVNKLSTKGATNARAVADSSGIKALARSGVAAGGGVYSWKCCVACSATSARLASSAACLQATSSLNRWLRSSYMSS